MEGCKGVAARTDTHEEIVSDAGLYPPTEKQTIKVGVSTVC